MESLRPLFLFAWVNGPVHLEGKIQGSWRFPAGDLPMFHPWETKSQFRPPEKLWMEKCFISLLRCRMAHFQGWSVSFRESFFSPEPLEKSQVNNQRFVPGRCGRSFPQQPSVYGFSAWSTWPLGAAISPPLPEPWTEGLPPFSTGVSSGHKMFPRDLQKLYCTSFQAVTACKPQLCGGSWITSSYLGGVEETPFLECQQNH